MLEDVLLCPLCDVPHRRATTICDHCGQNIHQPLDVARLRADGSRYRTNVVIAAGAIVVMIALNVAVFGGSAYVVCTAPLAFGLWNGYRLRAVSAALARVE